MNNLFRGIISLGLLLVFLVAIDLAAGTAFGFLKGYPYSATQLSPHPWEAPRVAESERGKKEAQAYRGRDPYFHHGLKPNTEWQAAWGPINYAMKTNSLGFRDAGVREVPLTSDAHRLLFIGDSFTEGVGVEYEKTFVGRVADALSADNIEVLNAGVISYSPLLYLRKVEYFVEQVGLDVDTLVVFVDISDGWDDVVRYVLNDKGEIVSNRSFPRPPKRGQLKKFFRDYGMISFLMTHIPELQDRQNPATNNPRAIWTFNEQEFERFGRQGLENMGRNMSALYELCQRHNIDLMMAIYPYPDQVVSGVLQDRHVQFWTQWSQNHSVPLLNMYPAFIDTSLSRDARMTVARDHYFARDTHWNARGHARVGELFLEVWKDSGMGN